MNDEMTLSGLLARRLATAPDATMIIERERGYTVREFDGLCRSSAAWLTDCGVGPGDRVAIWLENRIEWLALFFGLARLGAAAVAVNTRFRADEVAYLLSRSGATLLVTQRRSATIDFPAVLAGVDPASVPALQRVAIVDPAPDGCGDLLGRPTLVFDALERAAPTIDDRASPDSLAILFTTSGTTRGPKLVMHPQRTLVVHASRVAPAHGLDRDGARLLAALPLCGTFGMAGALAALTASAPVVLLDSFDAKRACELLARDAITHMYGSDEMFRRILDVAPQDRPFPAARIFGFAAFRADGEEVARAAWGRGVPMTGLYGSSEVQALFAMQPGDAPLAERVKAGGRPAAGPDAEVRIRDADTGALLPAGEAGTIEIRAPGNFVGYLNDPDATAEAIGPDGFFRTGDIGYLRTDGTFVYETRAGDAMRLGGYLVNPYEIETALRRIRSVADAQVVPVEIAGQRRCVAFVVPAPGAAPTQEEIVAEVGRMIAGFKVPSRVWFVEAFPTAESANGNKVQRARLRAMAAERLAAELDR